MSSSDLEFSPIKKKRNQTKKHNIILPKLKRKTKEGLETPAPLPSQNSPQAKYNLGTIASSLT